MMQSLFHKAQRAIKRPDLAKKTILKNVKNYSYLPRNKKKALEQRNKNSRVGLVLNWGLHQRGDWTVAEYPFFVRKFIKKFDPVIITSQKEYDRHRGQLDNIFAFGARNNKGPTLEYRGDQTVLLFASDPNNRPDWLHSYIKNNNINYALTPYYQPFLNHIPEFDESNLIHFPWAVPDEFVIDPELIDYNGDEYVAITGASGSEIYEIRDWCRSQTGVKSFQTSGHRDKRFTHKGYYTWLRDFDAMIAAGSFNKQWQYLFAKYYEIPAAGALLFAQYAEDLNRAGFSEENSIIFQSKEEFNKKKNEYLNHPEEYIDIRRQGTNLISDHHTITERLDLIEKLFK